MPKVTKKQGQSPLVEAAPTALDTVTPADEQPSTSGQPLAPKFPPLSAFEQSGKKIEFRRVRVHMFAN